MLDPALLRAGRFDLLLELPVPGEKSRLEILRVHTRDRPLAADVDLQELAHLTEGCTGADLEGLCREASLAAIRHFLAQEPAPPLASFDIPAVHFREAYQRLAGHPVTR
jgi:transitional endoplasmic reticulum ATPase